MIFKKVIDGKMFKSNQRMTVVVFLPKWHLLAAGVLSDSLPVVSGFRGRLMKPLCSKSYSGTLSIIGY